ncbi:MAG: hypothetical protein CMB64_04960 [Euryarchaeota archaeon]|nr:hypothetical protein [Euryarchaeota archaeon]
MENDYRVYELRDPKYWGPTFWKFLYLSAMGLPYSLTSKHKQDYETLFRNFASYLPCAECRYHYSQMIKQMTLNFETRDDVITTIIDIHNSVRQRQSKKLINYEGVLRFHYHDMTWGVTNNQQVLQCSLISILIFCCLRKVS